MELYSNIWTIIESVGFFIIVMIFFMDPIRRWNFFGYRPTAVMGLFDPQQGKVLISKVNKAWSFNQGGMYGNDIYMTVSSILKRELGIRETRYKLVYTKPLGAVRLKNKQLINRARISTISIMPSLRGKGYMGCFIRINLHDIEKEIKKGAGIVEAKVVDIAEAKKLVLQHTTEENQPRKQQMIMDMLSEIETFSTGVKQWEAENPEEAENINDNPEETSENSQEKQD